MKNNLIAIGTSLLLTTGSLLAVAQDAATNTPPATPPTNEIGGAHPTVDAFQILQRRNIFDPNRSVYRPQGPAPRVPLVETFSLRGCGDKAAKGYTAFFEGSGVRSDMYYTNDVINGFKIQEITLHDVKLIDTKGTNNDVLTMREQTGLRREDGGPWRTAYVSETFPTFARSTPQAEYSSSNNSSEQYSNRQSFNADDNSGEYNVRTSRSFNQDTGNGFNGGGGRRNRTRGGGFGETTGNGVISTFSVQSTTSAAPAGPIDPAILERMRQRRAQENQ